MLELVKPTTALRLAWLDAQHEWGPGPHEDGFGLLPSDQVHDPVGFGAWVDRLNSQSDVDSLGTHRAAGICRWIVENGEVLGGIALRLEDDEVSQRLGHLGYGIRPSARRRGVASWALGRMLEVARQRGMRRLVLVCEVDNVASARTIELNGGVLESDDTVHSRDAVAATHRYRIEL